MDKEQNARRVAAISSAYRGRAEAVRAGREREKPNETETPEEIEDVTSEPPRESWKKADIIDWLLDNGIEAERSDLEEQTKAELIENFVDDEG